MNKGQISNLLRNFRLLFITDKLRFYPEKIKKNELIIRGNVKEGHCTYSAFYTKGFMENLFKNAVVLEHIETKPYKKNACRRIFGLLKLAN